MRRQATVAGRTNTVTTVEDRSHKPVRMSHAPHALHVGTAAEPWTYTTDGALLAIPGYIDAIAYEADGQTRRIDYANGVYTSFFYSATRRWLTRIVTVRPNGAKLIDTIYSRDAAGRITAIAGTQAKDATAWRLEGRRGEVVDPGVCYKRALRRGGGHVPSRTERNDR